MIAVIQFPGSNCDLDVVNALLSLGIEAKLVWHRDLKPGYDSFILPGGFSYGDYLRAGIIAAHSPAMKVVKEEAKKGKPVLGICNGFQILIETGLLPGALLPNSCLKFICKWVKLRVESRESPFSMLYLKGQEIALPIAHNQGRYFIGRRELRELERDDRIIFRYSNENPNGSIARIAGICNLERNVLGLMPHPERACNPLLSQDGKLIFLSMLVSRRKRWR
jgi:phosphoribosylformylglycinamidine synthase